ncbi:S1 family peptidase [Usitatibacter palustris]|uniref:Chaperone protein DnaJ n=1 Tax=Usitatibacter palustris TaxID=2732487 RepID=A0A6M4H6Y9_9PROT|nr:serine protease [Usitatibacter palustris]QJR15391.1 Chaperone protein DnaJ [Usitatibacter palustris]
MAVQKDYYEVLGIPRNAKLTDVHRAYNRWVAEFKKETTPPDPRRESLLKEALEVLSDDDRRDAYDKELAAANRAATTKKALTPAGVAGGLVALAAVGGIAFFLTRPSGPPPQKARGTEEIRTAMQGAVSPLVSFDMSGKTTPMGLAFVIEDKVMVANCQALAPGAQLAVSTGTKQVPARVTQTDEALGLCKLLTDGYVGEPVAVNSTPPAVGAKVFGATLGAKGEIGFKEAAVTKVVDEGGGKAIESSMPTQPGGYGAPLLDAQGKVVAVATLKPDGTQLYRVVPAGWLAENRPKIEEARPYQGSGGGGTSARAESDTTPARAVARQAGAGGGGGEAEGEGEGCNTCDIYNSPDIKASRDKAWAEIEAMPPGPQRDKRAELQRSSDEDMKAYAKRAQKMIKTK